MSNMETGLNGGSHLEFCCYFNAMGQVGLEPTKA